MADANPQVPKLQELFEEIWKIYEFADSCEEPLASDKVQDTVYFGVKKCEQAVQMVNELALFSDNESLEEVATSEIKYMLLPALLGFFNSQTTRAERLPLIKKAKTFFVDYVRLCKNYDVTDIDLLSPDEEEEEEPPGLPAVPRGMNMQAMAMTRHSKIEQFHRKKEREKKMKELFTLMQNETVDDEVKREYYVTLLKTWVDQSIVEIDSINSEIPILEHMARMKAEQKKHPDEKKRDSPPKKPGRPFRPFILTKDTLQKSVFGAGYPSVPTYTIEEFYQQKVDDGTFNPPESAMGNLSLQDRSHNPDMATEEEQKYLEEQERKVDMDDEEELQRKREMDDWKDDHRRGWGNRKNML